MSTTTAKTYEQLRAEFDASYKRATASNEGVARHHEKAARAFRRFGQHDLAVRAEEAAKRARRSPTEGEGR